MYRCTSLKMKKHKNYTIARKDWICGKQERTTTVKEVNVHEVYFSWNFSTAQTFVRKKSRV